MGGAMNDDLVSVAIPRPPVNAFWSYIQIGSYIIGTLGVCVCLVASVWKLKKPTGAWMRHARQDGLNNGYNNIDDDRPPNKENKSNGSDALNLCLDDDGDIVFDKDYNTKIRDHRK